MGWASTTMGWSTAMACREVAPRAKRTERPAAPPASSLMVRMSL